jgi:hypothetical protein
VDEITVRPGKRVTIRYDGPLTAEQAGSMRRRLAEALPGVEVVVVLVGQHHAREHHGQAVVTAAVDGELL